MATVAGAIVDTNGRSDFWAVAAKHGVLRYPGEHDSAVPAFAFIYANVDLHSLAVPAIAQSLSAELGSKVLGFFVQSTSDVYEYRVFERGTLLRELSYAREAGGWLTVEGPSQTWEKHFFFDEPSSTSQQNDAPWPDMLDDDISDEGIARYEVARTNGDPSSIMDLLHPSSTASLKRVIKSFGLDPDAPHAFTKAPLTKGKIKAWAIGFAILLLLVGGAVLGATWKR